MKEYVDRNNLMYDIFLYFVLTAPLLFRYDY